MENLNNALDNAQTFSMKINKWLTIRENVIERFKDRILKDFQGREYVEHEEIEHEDLEFRFEGTFIENAQYHAFATVGIVFLQTYEHIKPALASDLLYDLGQFYVQAQIAGEAQLPCTEIFVDLIALGRAIIHDERFPEYIRHQYYFGGLENLNKQAKEIWDELPAGADDRSYPEIENGKVVRKYNNARPKHQYFFGH